jgi:hypothetical protein
MALSSQHKLHDFHRRHIRCRSTNVRLAGRSAHRAAAPAPCRAAAVDAKSVVAELLADIASIPGAGGSDTPADVQARILSKVEQLKAAQQGSTTTQASTLSATWKLLWTTEKETLFIVKNAPIFGTKAGGVYQASAVQPDNNSKGSYCCMHTAFQSCLQGPTMKFMLLPAAG